MVIVFFSRAFSTSQERSKISNSMMLIEGTLSIIKGLVKNQE